MKITQFHVKNQFIVSDDNGATFFQSYSTIIAKKHNGKVTLDENSWDCSVTTSKYRNLFLGEDKKATERKIKDGTYKLENLNG